MMNSLMNNDPTLSYRQAAARGTSPVGQVVALYDTILRDLLRALAALQARDVETRVFELNHALLVIAHLQNVLDFERGGDAAKQLEQLYITTRGMIVQANIKATPEAIEEIVNLYGGLRQAWYQAEQHLSPQQSPEPAPANYRPEDTPEPRAESDTNEQFGTPQVQWSA
ncbi:MAG: flagellar export chaperone FliS [Acidobacteriia bacterium]|nr:flagellar export chaperone FliS [Terriglobia bacterium]